MRDAVKPWVIGEISASSEGSYSVLFDVFALKRTVNSIKMRGGGPGKRYK